MSEVKIITDTINEKQVVDTKILFEYRLTNRETKGNKIFLTFVRDDNLPYLKDLEKLEEEYPKYKIGSMLPTIIFPIISFILFTVFLILMFALKDNFNVGLYFLCLILPAIISLAAAVLFMVIRMKMVNKIEKEKPEIDQKFQKKISALK